MKWRPDPDFGSTTSFVFFYVDVAGHSELVRNAGKSNRRMKEVHEILKHVKDFVQDLIPDYRKSFLWSWAGDGGIYAFPADNMECPTTQLVVEIAIRLFTEWDRMNNPYIRERNGGDGVHIHMTLGRGSAYFVKHPGMRRSDALNIVAKTKGPSRQTSILIFDEILDDLPPHLRERFAPIRVEHDKKQVYAYVPAMDQALTNLAKQHEADGEHIEAAHCSYRRAALNIAIGDHDEAIRAFNESIRLVDGIDENIRHRFFRRTIRAFYAAWRDFLQKAPRALFAEHPEDRRELLLTDAAADFFRSSREHGRIGNLLTHVEYMFEQLDILATKIVNEPAGLTTLEICQLLQRCGYSRRYESQAMRDRLERIRTEMADNHHRSLDGDCSICSSAAASCLLMAGDKEHADELLDWLQTLEADRFCHLGADYTDAKANEHALHYASVVLSAFVDCDAKADLRKTYVGKVKEALFDKWSMPEGSLPREWMRHRNINELEVTGYILPNLLHYALAGNRFDETETAHIQDVLDVLTGILNRESQQAGSSQSPGRIYAARESLGGFALALLDGVKPREDWERIVRHALSLFETRARRRKAKSLVRQQTLDSQVDRTYKMLTGWLLQWEVILDADAAGRDLPRYAERMLTDFDWAKRTDA